MTSETQISSQSHFGLLLLSLCGRVWGSLKGSFWVSDCALWLSMCPPPPALDNRSVRVQLPKLHSYTAALEMRASPIHDTFVSVRLVWDGVSRRPAPTMVSTYPAKPGLLID